MRMFVMSERYAGAKKVYLHLAPDYQESDL